MCFLIYPQISKLFQNIYNLSYMQRNSYVYARVNIFLLLEYNNITFNPHNYGALV